MIKINIVLIIDWFVLIVVTSGLGYSIYNHCSSEACLYLGLVLWSIRLLIYDYHFED